MSDELLERHRRACDGFSRIAAVVPADGWERATPCTDWDTRALVEHLIGFHDFLLLRPLGVRANRPRTDPAARWEATRAALFDALGRPGVLDQSTELPGGGQSSPRTMLAALTTDVLVHTWDLAVAQGLPPGLDPELCATALADVRAAGLPRDSGMFAAEVRAPVDADAVAQLIAMYGRDPRWSAEA